MLSNKNNILLIIYLAALIAVTPFATDIYLASMPTIQHLFHTTSAQVQLTLSLFFVTFAIAQLFWGPLSDRIGRKPTLFIGMSIFIVGSLICAFSHTISLLIIARIIQSFGACSGVVMAMAIVKDIFPDPTVMSKVLSRMMSVGIVAPMIAPIIGSYLLVYINWEANFYFLSVYGILLIIGGIFIQESYPKENRKPLPISKLSHAYLEQLKYIPFLLAITAVSTNFSALFSFISASSFIYIDIYHLRTHLFGYFFAFNAAALIIGSLSLPKLKNKFNDPQIVFSAILISLLGSCLMVLMIVNAPTLIWGVAVPCFIVSFGIGILYPEITSHALKNVVSFTGIASSLLGTSRFILAAGVGFLMGFFIRNSALPMALSMLILNALTLLTMLYYFKHAGK